MLMILNILHYLLLIISACLMLLERTVAKARSVCLCPSITHVSHARVVQDTEIKFAPHDRAMFLVS